VVFGFISKCKIWMTMFKSFWTRVLVWRVA